EPDRARLYAAAERTRPARPAGLGAAKAGAVSSQHEIGRVGAVAVGFPAVGGRCRLAGTVASAAGDVGAGAAQLAAGGGGCGFGVSGPGPAPGGRGGAPRLGPPR